MTFTTTARGQRISEPGTPSHPDETDDGVYVCGSCGDHEVSGPDEPCAECLALEEEKRLDATCVLPPTNKAEAERDFNADLKFEADRMEG